jgi:DNA-binding NtrC family response regulator
MGKHAPELEDEALASLSVYSWPGNVRELRNTIERAIVVAEGPIITVDDLPDEVTRRAPRILRPSEPVLQVKPDRKKRKEDRLKEEREQLVRALAEANGNKTIAARALGIPRSTLLSKLQRHGLQ